MSSSRQAICLAALHLSGMYKTASAGVPWFKRILTRLKNPSVKPVPQRPVYDFSIQAKSRTPYTSHDRANEVARTAAEKLRSVRPAKVFN